MFRRTHSLRSFRPTVAVISIGQEGADPGEHKAEREIKETRRQKNEVERERMLVERKKPGTGKVKAEKKNSWWGKETWR